MIAIQHNTPVLITSDCNQRNQLRDRQVPQFFTEFADECGLSSVASRSTCMARLATFWVSFWRNIVFTNRMRTSWKSSQASFCMFVKASAVTNSGIRATISSKSRSIFPGVNNTLWASADNNCDGRSPLVGGTSKASSEWKLFRRKRKYLTEYLISSCWLDFL